MLSMPSGLNSTDSSLDTVHWPAPRRWKLARPATSSTRIASAGDGRRSGERVEHATHRHRGHHGEVGEVLVERDDAEAGEHALRGFGPARRPAGETSSRLVFQHGGHTQPTWHASHFTASSLDGFVVDDAGSLDWLTLRAIDPDGPFGYRAFAEDIGALVMGATTTNGSWRTSPASGCTASPPGC